MDTVLIASVASGITCVILMWYGIRRIRLTGEAYDAAFQKIEYTFTIGSYKKVPTVSYTAAILAILAALVLLFTSATLLAVYFSPH